MSAKTVSLLSSFLFALAAIGLSVHSPATAEQSDTEAKPRKAEFLELSWSKARQEGISFSEAGPKEISEKARLYGETVVNGNTLAHVVPRFPGTIVNVAKQLGDSVVAGDLLATIRSNESLTNYQVVAGIDGVILDQDATTGEFVTNEKVLFRLVNLETTWANIAVPPHLLSSVRVGTEVEVTSQSTQASISTPVTYVRPTLSEATRSGQARVVLPNEQGNWPPGMFITAEIPLTATRASIAIPSDAVLLIENKPSVFVKATMPDGDEGFELKHIRTGRTGRSGRTGNDDQQWTEVTDGLAAGESVATGDTFILKAEMGKSSAGHSH